MGALGLAASEVEPTDWCYPFGEENGSYGRPWLWSGAADLPPVRRRGPHPDASSGTPALAKPGVGAKG